MKKHWPVVLAGFSILLSLILLLQVFRLDAALKHTQEQLTLEMQQLGNSLFNSLNDIANQSGKMLSVAEDANTSIDSYALYPLGLDEETRTLRAEIVITLKQWSADTTATLEVSLGEKSILLPLTVENGICTGELDFPCDQIFDVSMELVYAQNGANHRESVGTWDDLSMLLPVQASYYGFSSPVFKNNEMILENCEFSPMGYDFTAPSLTETEFRFYRNDEELILTVPVSPTRSADDDIFGAVTYCGGLCRIPLQSIYRLNVTFCCTDEYGLHYEFPLWQWFALPHGEWTEGRSLSNHPPKLSWN